MNTITIKHVLNAENLEQTSHVYVIYCILHFVMFYDNIIIPGF